MFQATSGRSRSCLLSLSYIIVFVFCRILCDGVPGDMWEEQVVPLPLLLWTTKNAASHSLYQQQYCTVYIRLYRQYCSNRTAPHHSRGNTCCKVYNTYLHSLFVCFICLSYWWCSCAFRVPAGCCDTALHWWHALGWTKTQKDALRT